jgi:alanine dehydrogenase
VSATLLLTRQDLAALLSLEDCIGAVEEAFRRHGAGEVPQPGILGQETAAGGFHIKAGLLDGRYAVKINANFPGNLGRTGLPAIQGLIALFDAESGRPLAVMDSIHITLLRTGAATAVAARYLAREDSATLTVCGCGNQGRVQLRSVCAVRPIREVSVYDLDQAKAEQFAQEMCRELGLEVRAVADPRAAARRSDLCVTCTPSRTALLGPQDVRPGSFVAAIGADAPHKQELDPALLAASRVVVDVLDQAATIGDLHHAIEQRLMTREQVHAELGAVIAGLRPGRTSPAETFIFDSTGMALQDAAAAILAYRKALRQGLGQTLRFSH